MLPHGEIMTTADQVPKPTSSIAPPIGELIEIFSKHLPDVEFPEVSASSLEELGCKVAAAHSAVEELEQQLQNARDVHREAEYSLLKKSQSALGYAKVYASDNEDLLSALSGIQIGKKSRSETTRRKPRKAKTQQATLLLPTDAELEEQAG